MAAAGAPPESRTTIVVNGEPWVLAGSPQQSLLALLRTELGLTGTKPGCGEGECGACTVLVDGSPLLACQTSVAGLAGKSVTTIEGLATGDRLHPVQRALIHERASQCGYCTPGMALRAAALLSAVPNPTSAQVGAALQPNVCRCGCYPRIRSAIHRAADEGTADQPVEEPAPMPLRLLARPRRPWDLCEPQQWEWSSVLGDGLMVVWPTPASAPGMWPTGGGAWLHVSPSGLITAFTGKVDIGQDNQTALGLLVAEELAIRPAHVWLVQGDTDLCPFDVGTFGSRSMPDAGGPLRRAAAGTRQVLLALAAERWGTAGTGRLTAHAGEVISEPDGKRLAYGELVTGLRRLEILAAEPALSDPAAWHLAGHEGYAAPRLDVVTGGLRFGSDLELAGMRHGAVLRPPTPGCTLRAADTSRAAQMPGVTVVRQDDFVGVTAPDAGAARRAVAAISADWDQPAAGPADLPAYLRRHPAAGVGWERATDDSAGDVGAALDAAATIVQSSYSTAYLAHVPLETSAAVAEWDGDARLTVWAGCNVPFGVRSQLAGQLGLDESEVRVIVPPTGGGFGGKHGEVAFEAARLARADSRPVRVHWSRAEEFTCGYLRPMALVDIRAGLDAAGSIVGWDYLDINAGAQGSAFPYQCENWRIRYQPAASPVAQGPYRALAATANTFARESCIDELAHGVGIDPVRFRLDRLADARLATVLRAAAARFGWDAEESGVAHGLGWGCAAGLEKGGRVATFAEVRSDDAEAITVTRIVTAYECGAIVNPDTVTAQVEGGTIMALGGALFEEVLLDHGRLASERLADYRVPRFSDVPAIDVLLLDRRDIPSSGAGETPLIAVAPAVANAIFAATGRRLRSLPLIPGGQAVTSGMRAKVGDLTG